MSGATNAKVPIDLCNLALGKLGSKFITSITGGDDSNEAAQCANCYYDLLFEMLGAAPWSFAQNRIMLATTSLTPAYTTDNCTIVYAYPSDFIKGNLKNFRWARVKFKAQGILSDTQGLGIEYTFKNLVVPTYFPQFNTAFACRIAAEICFALTNSVKKADALMKEYEEIRLPEAISSDSQQGTPQPIIADEWENSRLVGNPALLGQSGQDVWWPIN